jgi:hypothetical protein
MHDHMKLDRHVFQYTNIRPPFIHAFSEYPNLDFNQAKRRSDLSALAFNAYISLAKLCTSLHGSVEKNTKLVSGSESVEKLFLPF